MGVIKVAPRWQDRGATTDENGVRTLTRGWFVTTDDDATGEPEVIDSVGDFDSSVGLYKPHPNWKWAICRKIVGEPNGSARQWLVKADYSTAPFPAKGDGSGGANTTTPDVTQSNSQPADQRAPTIQISRKEVTKVLEKDAVTGDRVVNTVGDPFDPSAEVFRSHQLITFKFYRTPAQLNWALRGGWHDTINSKVVTILGKNYPALTLRCTAYDLDTVWETGPVGLALFFALTVQAEYDPDGWQPKILNTGRRRWVGSLGDPSNPRRLAAIVDGNGQPVADPVPLTAGGDVVDVNVANPVYHYVEPAGYFPVDWNGGGASIYAASAILF